MVPTLKKDDIQDRMDKIIQSSQGVNAIRPLRKRANTSVERKINLRLGKLTKSSLKPKTGLENTEYAN